MTYTPLQIEIIKKFGRKELMAGCIFKYGDYYSFYCHPGTSFHIVQKLNADTYAIGNEDFRKIEILGHPPTLEDIFRLAEERGWKIGISDANKIEGLPRGYSIEIYKNYDCHVIPILPTLPLIEQDESTLSQLLSLFK